MLMVVMKRRTVTIALVVGMACSSVVAVTGARQWATGAPELAQRRAPVVRPVVAPTPTPRPSPSYVRIGLRAR